ncbi:hypothetical protein [Parabacteroides sp. FAFU027]|uniref:hypothetical protein n=1 Tax=Parabacteroides sp. FAFU027 TaxID=2922715 RepID=UPI001FB02225|nr:hypothetical protein [Parabacteroides sp. FAFU027]
MFSCTTTQAGDRYGEQPGCLAEFKKKVFMLFSGSTGVREFMAIDRKRLFMDNAG